MDAREPVTLGHKPSIFRYIRPVLYVGVFLFIGFLVYLAPYLFKNSDGSDLAFLPKIESAAATNVACSTITWTNIGSQTASVSAPATGQYMGGAFKGTCNNSGSGAGTTVSTATISLTNNPTNSTGLSNLKLYTDGASGCTTANPAATATLAGTTASVGYPTTAVTLTTGGAIGKATATNWLCVYVYMDVDASATDGKTVEVSLSNATYTTGSSAGLPQSIAGTTTISVKKTITGTVYSDEGTTAVSCQTTIKLAIGSSLWGSAATCAGNVYTIANVTGISAGSVLTVFNDTATSADRFVIVTKADDGTTTLTLNAYKGRMIIRNDSTGSITNSTLTGYCGSGCTGNSANIQFTNSTGAITVTSGTKALVWTGVTFAPGANFTADTLEISGTYTGATETLTLMSGGITSCTADNTASYSLCTNGGTFTTPATTKFLGDGTASGSGLIEFTGLTFANLELGTNVNATYTEYIPLSDLTVTGILQVGNASNSANPDELHLSLSTILTLSGTGTPLNITAGGIYSGSPNTTTKFTGNGATVACGSSVTYANLQLLPSSTSAQTLCASSSQTLTATGLLTIGDGTHAGATGATNNPTISTATLTIAAGATFTTGTGTLTVSGSGTPITKTGTLTVTSGNTFIYSGTAATNVTATTYYNLSFTPASGTPTFTLPAADITVNGNLVVSTGGTLTVSQNSLTISGDLTVDGTLSGSATGNVTVNGNAVGTGTINLTGNNFTQKVAASKNFGPTSGANNWTFKYLTFSKSAGTPTITTQAGTGSITVAANMVVDTGVTLDAAAKTWNLNGSSAPTDNLTAYYSMDDATVSGTALTDLSGNSNTGTISNGTSTPGINGQALNFTGTGGIDLANESNFDFDKSNSFSISSWVNVIDTGAAYHIFDKTVNGGVFPGYNFRFNGGTYSASFNMTGTGGCPTDCINVSTPATSFTTSVWHLVTVTYSGTSLASGVHIYIDGVDQTLTVSNDGLTTTVLNNTPATIGYSAADGGGKLKGSIDGVRVYSRVLTSGEVSNLYASSGPLTNNGTFTPSTSTVSYGATAATNVNGITYNNLTINAASGTPTFTLSGNATVNGALNITTGTLSQGATYNLTTGAVTVGASGTWSNLGTGDITLSGNVTNAGTVTLSSGNLGSCVDGTNDIVITSSVGGTQRTWSGAGTYTLRNLSVTDMLGALAAEVSTFSNSNWTDACGNIISGNFYDTNESTGLSGIVLALSRSAGTVQNYTTTAGGAFTFNVSGLTAGNIVTIYSTDASTKGTLVFKYGTSCTGTPNCTGLIIVAGAVTVDSKDAAALTNSDLAACDNDTGTGCTTTDVGFTSAPLSVASGRKLIVRGAFTPGGTVTTAAAATAANQDGDLAIKASATLTMGTNDLSIGGDYNNAGTLSVTSPQTTTFTATGTGFTITKSGSGSMDNVVYIGSGGEWTYQQNSSPTGNVTVTFGTLKLGSSTLTMAAGKTLSVGASAAFDNGSGTVYINGSGTGASRPFQMAGAYTAGTGSFNYQGDGDTTIEALTYPTLYLVDNNFTAGRVYTSNGAINATNLYAGAWNPGTGGLTFTLGGALNVTSLLGVGTSGSSTMTFNTSSYSVTAGSITDNGSLNFLANASTITLTSSGDVITVTNAHWTPGTSTVVYTGTSATNIPALTYNNLKFSPASGTPTYTLGAGTFTIKDWTMGLASGVTTVNVTAATNNPTINIIGNFVDNTAGYTPGTGITTFMKGGAQSIDNSFGCLTLDLGIVRISANGTNTTLTNSGCTGNFAISFTKLTIDSAQTLNTPTVALTITGSGTGASRPLIVNGTVTIDDTERVIYKGTLATEIEPTSSGTWSGKPDFKFIPASGSPTYTLGTASSQTFDMANLTIGDGTHAVTVTSATYNPTINIYADVTINSGGTYTKGTGVVTFKSGTSSQAFTDNNATKQDMGAIQISANTTNTTLTLASDIKFTSLTVDSSQTFSQGASYSLTTTGTAGTNVITINGTWSNLGTGDITLSGDVTNAGTVTLSSGNLGSCVDGANDIVITSTVGGTQRTWGGAGTYTLRNLSVTDMLGALTAGTSTFSNSNWTEACSSGITISGTVYSDEGSTVVTSTPTVRIKVNGLGSYTAAANGSGVYSISSITIGSAGDVITVYLDTNGGIAAATITRAADTTTNITSLNLYQNRVIVRHEDAGPITNANLGQYDHDDDTDIPFTSNAGALYVNSGTKLIVWTGKSFTPGGTVTTTASSTASNPDGDLTIQTSATLTMGTNDLSIGGDYTNSGTLSVTSPQTTTFTATGTGFTITKGTGEFDAMTFNGSGGDWTPQDNENPTGNVTISAGTFILQKSFNIAVSKQVIVNAGGTINGNSFGFLLFNGSGTGIARPFYVNGGTNSGGFNVQYQGDGDTDIEGGSYKSIYMSPTVVLTADRTYTTLGALTVTGDTIFRAQTSGSNLIINLGGSLDTTGQFTIGRATGPTTTLNTNNYALSSTWYVDINATGIFNAGSSTITFTADPSIGGVGDAQLFINPTGAFNAQTSTVIYNATHDIEVTAATYNNLTFSPVSSATYTLPASDITLRGDLSINNQTTVTKSASNKILFARTGTGTSTITSTTSSDLGIIQVSNGGGNTTLSLGSDFKATKLTIDASQTLDLNGSHNLVITGTGSGASRPFIMNGSFTASTGRISYTGDGDTEVETKGGTMSFYILEVDCFSFTAVRTYTANGGFTATNDLLLGIWCDNGASAGVTFKLGGTTTLGGIDFSDNGSGSPITIDTTTNNYALTLGTIYTSGYALEANASTITFTGTDGNPLGALNDTSFHEDTSTIVYASTVATTVKGLTYYNLTINASSGSPTYTLDNNTTVSGALNITVGTLSQGASYNLTTGAVTVGASGTWSNLGTGDITLSGNVTNNGTVILSSGNLGSCVDGTNDIVITSSVGGTQRTWGGTGTYTLRNLSVTDMLGALAAEVSTTSNSDWTDGCVVGITISGTLYSDDGTTLLTSGPLVRVKINGAGSYSATANGSGVYSISGVTTAAGNVVTVYLDTNGGAKGVVVTRAADSSTNITSLNLYQNRVIVRHEDAGPITNTNLDQYDSGNDGDIPFTVTTGALTVSSGTKLIVWTGKSFTPGGTVTTTASSTAANPDGDIDIQTSATLTMGTNDLSIGGDYNNAGTLSVTSPQTTTFTATGTGFTITKGTGEFDAMTFNGSGGDWTMQDNENPTGNVTVTAGTFKVGSNALTTAVGKVINVAGTLDNGTGQIRINGTGTGASRPFIVTGTFASSPGGIVKYQGDGDTTVEGLATYYSLQVLCTNATAVRNFTANGSITANRVVVGSYCNNGATAGANFKLGGDSTFGFIDNGDSSNTGGVCTFDTNNYNVVTGSFVTDGAASAYYVANGSTITINNSPSFDPLSLALDANFDEGTSTIVYGGNSDMPVHAMGYYNLSFTPSSGTPNYTLPSADLTIKGNLLISSGATITKSASNKIIFAKGSAGQTVTDSNATKSDLGKIQVSANTTNTTLNLGSSINVTSLTIDASQTLSLNGSNTLTLTGSGTVGSRPFVNNGTFTASTGTVDYEGTSATDIETTNVTYNNLNLGSTSDVAAGVTYSLNGNGAATGLITIGNASSTNADTLTTTGSNYSLTAGQITITAKGALTANGSTITISGSGTPFTNSGTFTPGGSTVKFNGTSDAAIQAMDYNNLWFNNSNYPTYTIGAGTMNVKDWTIDTAWVDLNTHTPTINITGDFSATNSAYVQGGNATLVFKKGGTQTVNANGQLPNVRVSANGGGSATTFSFTQTGGIITSMSSLTIDNNQTVNLNGNTLRITGTTSGTCTNQPLCIGTGVTFNTAGSTVEYRSASTATVAATTYNNLVLNKYPDSAVYTLPSGNITVTGNLEIDNNATVTKGSGTIIFAKAGGGTSSWTDFNATPQDMGAVQVSANSGVTTLNLGSLVKATSLLIDASQIVNLGTYTLTLTGNSTPLTATGTLNDNTGTIEFASAATTGTTVPARTYYNLKLNKAGNTFTVPAGTLATGNNLDITAGTLDLNTNDPTTTVSGTLTIGGTLSASNTNNLTFAGDFINNGTFTHNSGTVVADMTGTADVPKAITMGGSAATTTFNNFTVSNVPAQSTRTLNFKTAVSSPPEFDFNGVVNFTGKPSNLLVVQSDTPGTQWMANILAAGSSSLNFVNVKDSGCANGTKSFSINDTIYNLGNNGTCWSFVNRGGGNAVGNPGLGGGSGGGTPAGGGGGQGGGGGSTSGGGGGVLPQSFTATDATSLTQYDSSWTVLAGSFAINTNAITATGGVSTHSIAKWTAGSFGNDQFSEVTVNAQGADYIGTCVRLQTSTASGYCAEANNAGTRILLITNGSVASTLFSDSTVLSAGEVLHLEITGSALTLKRGSTVITSNVSDATYSSGLPGLKGYGNTQATLGDNWYAGTLASQGGGGGGGISP